MKNFLDILDENYVQNIILIVTVLTTIIIYYCQKWAAKRDAARAIVIQIDIVNRRVDSLARITGNDVTRFDVEKTDIQLSWEEDKNGWKVIRIDEYGKKQLISIERKDEYLLVKVDETAEMIKEERG